MAIRLLFAVLPYLRTKRPFVVAGTVFRSSHDVGDLASEEVEHLSRVISSLCMADGEPVTEVLYALARLDEDSTRMDVQVRHLRDAHTILAFLLLRDYAYDTLEQCAVYAFIPTEVVQFGETSMSLVPGYLVRPNWIHPFELPYSKTLHLPQPYPDAVSPMQFHLSDIADAAQATPLVRAFWDFTTGRLLHRPEQAARLRTLLRAMTWYNKSYSVHAAEDEKLIHLAIAFETLFHRKDSSLGIQEELTTHLRGLFGEARRLEDWVQQFYGQRSRVVHEGLADEWRFVIGGIRREGQKLYMDSLVNYGRRLFRMCILNLSHATLVADREGLGAWLVHDQERLQAVCRELGKTEIPAEERLRSVVGMVFDLGEVWVHYLHREAVDLKTVHAAGVRLIETYLEAYPETEDALRQSMEHVAGSSIQNAPAVITAYSSLAADLARGVATYRGLYWPREPRQALAHFAKYASHHRFRAKARSKLPTQATRPDSSVSESSTLSE